MFSYDEKVLKNCIFFFNQIAGDHKAFPTTRITFLTAGFLLEIYGNMTEKPSYDYVILDEVHGADMKTDLLLLQL